MLTKKEERMLRKYYSRTMTCLAFLVMILVGCALWVVSVMIADIALNSTEKNDLCMYGFLAITAVYMVAFAYHLGSIQFGMRGEKWAALVAKARVAVTEKDYSGEASAAIALTGLGRLMDRSEDDRIRQGGAAAQVAGGVAAGALVFGLMSQARGNIRKVAQALGVKLPSGKKEVFVIVAVPLLLIIGTNIPHYMRAIEHTTQAKQLASAAVEKVETALEQTCTYVYWDDPMENYQDYGYTVRGYVKDSGEPNNTYLAAEVDNEGYVSQVIYNYEVDVSLTKEENLSIALQNFAALHQALQKAEVAFRSENLLWDQPLPQDFQELFTEKSYYEEFRENYEDLNMTVSYYTDSEEEYNSYSTSQIYISIEEME